MDIHLQVTERIAITEIYKGDLHQLRVCIDDPDIYANTLTVPHPYSMEDAETFYRHTARFRKANGFSKDRAIRIDGKLSGGIGLMYNFGLDSHKSEFGYWLARKHWGQGIMSLVVTAFVSHVFENTSIVRIEAHVFTDNAASMRVLEKAGFTKEGLLRNAFKKDGVLKDAALYAIISPPGSHN